MEMMLWNALLTIVVSFVGWVLKSKSDELQRVQILLNRTREEIAKEYVTKSEVHTDINRVLDRLDRLETKIDRMIESNRA
jgi:phage shock protein A